MRKHGVEAQKVQTIDSKLLYASKTLRQLAGKLSQVLATTGILSGPVQQDFDHATIRLLEKYDTELQGIVKTNAEQIVDNPSTQVVVLTGSTGSLGSYILSSLLARSDVKKVICLNRNGDAKAQSTSLRVRGLPEFNIDSERVKFLQVKPVEPKLGLTDEDYTSLMRETTSIIHNAFPVNFLLSLESFEPQFQYLLNLLRLAFEGQRHPAVIFVLSITAATSLAIKGLQGTIPEDVLEPDQAKHLLPQGYARAKYICERLLATYASIVGRPAAVLRVGQIRGPLSGTGVWNVSEWVPSLVLSSKYLEAIPGSLGSADID